MYLHLIFLFSLFAFELSSPLKCGKRIFIPHTNITGSRNASEGEFPWQVSIEGPIFFANFTHLCGGTILSKYTIVTAAQCFDLIR